MFHEYTVAFSHNEGNDWKIERYLNAEVENKCSLDRAVITDRGKLDQT